MIHFINYGAAKGLYCTKIGIVKKKQEKILNLCRNEKVLKCQWYLFTFKKYEKKKQTVKR